MQQGDHVKKRHLFAAAALALAIPLGGAMSAGATPKDKTQGQVIGTVRVTGEGRAEITARYICQPEFDHLWVSAKQVADRHPDKVLQGPESSGASAAWFQSHPQNFTCDGTWHTDSFVIGDGSLEYGFGTLEHGQAWVQFCLTSEEDESLLFMDTRWAAVK
jgi:hypothetical protein